MSQFRADEVKNKINLINLLNARSHDTIVIQFGKRIQVGRFKSFRENAVLLRNFHDMNRIFKIGGSCVARTSKAKKCSNLL